MPDVAGGVERHCEELYPRLVRMGYDVRLYARARYVSSATVFRGVTVVPLWAPRASGLEAFAHTARAIREAAKDECDLLHVHSVGPSALIPYARAIGHANIIATFHAPDYLQRKWGPVGRAALRAGERTGATQSSALICVSEWYASELARRYQIRPVYIPNGASEIGAGLAGGDYVEQEGLPRGAYLLYVGRVVPDKRVEDLLAAAQSLAPMTVVVVGEASGSSRYARTLADMAGDNVRFVGPAHGVKLAQLYAGAAALVLPSAAEGLPIVALEAMQFGLPVVMSDIPANREVSANGTCARLYPLGDTEALAQAIADVLEPETHRHLRECGRTRVREVYDWDAIAESTAALYRAVLLGRP